MPDLELPADDVRVPPLRRGRTLAERIGAARRVDALFRAMATDGLLQEQFITDPSMILAEYVYGAPLDRADAQLSNLLVHSVFANDRLLTWLYGYAAQTPSVENTRSQLVAAFSNAAVHHGAAHAVYAIVRSAEEGRPILRDRSALLDIVFNRAFLGEGVSIFGDTDGGTDTGTETGTEPGTETGTEPGTETGTEPGTETGTEPGTETGTEPGTETGTEPGTETGETLQAGGTLTAITWKTYLPPYTTTGTIPPITGPITLTGTGITRSPFTGTETRSAMTSDEEIMLRNIGTSYARPTLDSLMYYSSQLLSAGALELGELAES
jgi:hypothetical protein